MLLPSILDATAANACRPRSIRLNLLQSLGFTLLPQADASAPRKMLVRNDHADSVAIVEGLRAEDRADRAKRAALADRLWGLTGDGVET